MVGGGNCGQGAVSGLLGLAGTDIGIALNAGKIGQFVASTISGGLGSMAAGGSFMDGAQTAAFGYLFNQIPHELEKLTKGGYDQNDVRGGFNGKGESLVYHPDHYDPSAASELLLSGASLALPGGLIRGVFARVGIQFGADANQAYHAFRHIDAIGLSRPAVTSAIKADMRGVSLQIGQGVTRNVSVQGVDLTYRAHRASERIINVGRITGPR